MLSILKMKAVAFRRLCLSPLLTGGELLKTKKKFQVAASIN
jgi:hypothetical protein